MLGKWEFWVFIIGSGLAIALAGWGGKWEAAPGDAANYSDETSWAIRIGLALIAIGVIGLCVAYAASQERAQKGRPNINVSSRNQRGGITAGEVNINTKKDGDG